jgi:hypothetical protein
MNAHHFGCLIDVQATEEAQFDYARFARIEFRETFKRFVQRHQVGGLPFGDLRRFVEGDSLSAATALLVLLLARVVNKDSPHHFSANSKELGAILPMRFFLIDQPNVSFVNQRCRLQGVIATLAAHVVMREPVQFRIDQWNQSLIRGLIAIAPISQQAGDVF